MPCEHVLDEYHAQTSRLQLLLEAEAARTLAAVGCRPMLGNLA
jgi:hypothetical protein